ncbi:IclR family transcriptional regulator [Streptomyces sp. HNM1019]|uniref:IclR family transcriptional regulator n=1 Tax=Streptomyces sp. HNM1019 TaxID=3424717 RepID=UPI003D78AD75
MTALPNSVLGKAVALLNAYEPGDESLSLAELHRRTGIPKTTLHRMLGELGEWKVLERTRRGYRLGIRMFEWGQLVSVQRSLCDVAAPFLACLSEATHATVNLAVPEGPDVVYIQKINALDEPRRPPRVGGRLPMHCTALGKAILAHGLPGQLDDLVSGGLVGQTSRSVRDLVVLRAEIERVRARGFAEEREEAVVGVACVAAAVRNPSGAVVGAISVAGPPAKIDAARVWPTLRATAQGLSRHVGRRGPGW